jgi:lipopolysaccharide/colanic/teichoic acid biosynthesis glycosyltransferase
VPKSDGGHFGIGLLEPVLKVISAIIKERGNGTILFESSIHGLRAEKLKNSKHRSKTTNGH